MSKTIRLVNANLGKAATIESDAETWGELKTEESVQEFISGNTMAVIRENQNSLDIDSAALPSEKLTDEGKEEDFSLFFITKKSKAGGEDYNNWSFSQLRAEAASREGIEAVSPGNYGSRSEIIAKLEADDGEQGCESQLDRIESKVDFLVSKFDEVEDNDVQDNSNELQQEPSSEELQVARTIESQL